MDNDQGKGLKLGWVITEEIGEVIIDPSAYRVIMTPNGKALIEDPLSISRFEDFEPFEAEESEDFEP